MRYRTLTEGLEVTEVRWEELERTKRLDAEFYSKENLRLISLVKRLNASPLPHFVRIADGNHTSISQYFTDSGIPYYRGGDTCNPFIEFSPSPLRIPESIYQKEAMQRSHLRKGDILLSIVGTVGNVSQVTTDGKATCSCKLAILRPNEGLRAAYLATFLRSKYGQQQIEKFRRGSVQTGLILEDFDQLLVPVLGGDLQRQIDILCSQSLEGIKRSNELYASAIAYLQELLEIDDSLGAGEYSNVVSLRASFLTNGCLDAEYYQPRYDKLFAYLERYGTVPLGHIVSIEKSVEPGSKAYRAQGVPFVRVADLSPFGLAAPSVFLDSHEFADAPRPRKDTILLSKDGSVGIAYCVGEQEDIITSGAILHLHVVREDVLPDYLTLLLNSPVVRMQAERDAGGSIIQHWRVEEIERVRIPLLPRDEQEKIASMVQESVAQRRETLRLLEEAKRMVEQAIERCD